MTAPSPEPPVCAGDAMALAEVIVRTAGGRPLRDDVRTRVCASLSGGCFDSLVPYPGSLVEDPAHAAACFLAADARENGHVSPLLLLIAPAAHPPNPLFPGARRIGCSRLDDGCQVAVHAVPFSAASHREIRTFAGEIDTAFLPRPHGVQPVLTIVTSEPETGLPAAIQAWRQMLRGYGQNLASVDSAAADPDRLLDAALWSAIRAGWREGFSAGLCVPLDAGLEAARRIVRNGRHYSRFVFEAHHADFEELDRCVRLHDFIREIKSGQRPWKHFDLELSLVGSGVGAPDDVAFCLEWLKRKGCPAQAVAPDLDGIAKVPQLESCISALSAAARPFNATLVVRGRPDCPPASIERMARAASGRLSYEVTLTAGQAPDDIAGTLVDIAACLRG